MGLDDPELRRIYFDTSLRGCLVELVTACLQHRPGETKASNGSVDTYADEVLDPFFHRLAKDCIESQPQDLVAFMQDWLSKQDGEPEPLKEFIYTWCRSCPKRYRRQPQQQPAGGVTQQQHDALVSALSSTGLGCCAMVKLAEEAVDLSSLGIPQGLSEVEPAKVVALQLDQALRRAEKVEAELATLRVEHQKLQDESSEKITELTRRLTDETAELRKENLKLKYSAENAFESARESANSTAETERRLGAALDSTAELERRLAAAQAEAEAANARLASIEDAPVVYRTVTDGLEALKDGENDPPSRASDVIRQGSACMSAMLQVLLQDGRRSGAAAFAYFEPSPDGTVSSKDFSEKVKTLNVLEPEEIEELVKYLDPGNDGVITFEEFKAALLMALASSGELHTSLSEAEFDAVMWRIRAKIQGAGKTFEEAFRIFDVDQNGTLSREEFVGGIQRLQVGLSMKELAQVCYVLDVSGEEAVEFEEFQDAVESCEHNDLHVWAERTFRKVSECLMKEVGFQSHLEAACRKYAQPPEFTSITHDGLVKMIRTYCPSLTLTEIGRLWCVVDKVEDAAGQADVSGLAKKLLELKQ